MYLYVIYICQYVCSILGFWFNLYLFSNSRVFRTGMLQFSPPYRNFVPKFQYSYWVSTSVALSLGGAFISYWLIEISVSIGVIPTISIGTIFRCLSRSSVSRFSLSSAPSDLISICNYMPITIMQTILRRAGTSPCSDTTNVTPHPGCHYWQHPS